MKKNLIIPNIKNPAILILRMQLVINILSFILQLSNNSKTYNKRISRHNIKPFILKIMMRINT